VRLAADRLVLAIGALATTPGGIEALSVGSAEVVSQLIASEQYEHAAVLQAFDGLVAAVRRDVAAVSV
jgi:hypothetical protein